MTAANPNSLMIVAGEASGDLHAGALVAELRRRRPSLAVFGCGGQHLEAAGCELVVRAEEIAVVGLFEVVRHLPRIYGLYRRLVRTMRQRRPAGVVLVDLPDFNLPLARQARRAGIPAVYFISPQLWAWREGRVRGIRRNVRRMIAIFPFETDFYAGHGMEVAAVGHPLVDRVAEARAAFERAGGEAGFRARHGFRSDAGIVALLPGSRRGELARHLPVLLEAASRLRQARPGVEFGIPRAPTLPRAAIDIAIGTAIPPAQRGWVKVIDDDTYGLLFAARAVAVASGTATVETALCGPPLVVVYRLSPWTWHLGRRLVRTPHYAMVNLVAGRRVAPELIQQEMEAGAIVDWLSRLLEESPERRAQLADLAEVRGRLGPPGAISRAATAVEEALWAAPPDLGGIE